MISLMVGGNSTFVPTLSCLVKLCAHYCRTIWSERNKIFNLAPMHVEELSLRLLVCWVQNCKKYKHFSDVFVAKLHHVFYALECNSL